MAWDPTDEELGDIFELLHGTQKYASYYPMRKTETVELLPEQPYI
jgi:hypothetical protein